MSPDAGVAVTAPQSPVGALRHRIGEHHAVRLQSYGGRINIVRTFERASRSRARDDDTKSPEVVLSAGCNSAVSLETVAE